MITKNCTDCKITKPIEQFYKSKTHKYGVMVYCKHCFNQRCIQRWIKRKIKFINYFGGGCEKCNLKLENSHYSVFEFHHKVDHTKDFDWSKLRLMSETKIKDELSKCSLLCANCHRLEHAEIRNFSLS